MSSSAPEPTVGATPITIIASPRARRLRLRVCPRTGSVLLTVPKRVSRRRALAWASGHSAWIEAQLAQIPASTPLGPGAIVPLGGVPHLMDWDPRRPRRIEQAEGRILAGGPEEGLERRMVRWLKARAHALLAEETQAFAARAGVTASRIAVGDPVSRWGSCSASGAIRYSWRLILAPDHVRRATVAHEVAHLVHMNHGPDFHALVERLFGADPRPARLWLKREGAALHRIAPRA